MLETAENARWVGPDRRRPMIQWGGVAFVLITALVIVLNFFRRGIDDASEVEALGLPLFATIPRIRALSFGKKGGAARQIYSVAENDPQNVAVESLRGLRTGLQFSLATAETPSLMITSCAPSDGKSFIALNLATVWGQSGEKVLLIDADMRRGVLRRYFDLPKAPLGLSDILAGKTTVEEAVHHDPRRSSGRCCG